MGNYSKEQALIDWLRALHDDINTLAALSVKAQRYEFGGRLKASITDRITTIASSPSAQSPVLTDDMLRYAMAAIGTGSPRDAEMFRAFWRCAWEAAATAPVPPEIDYMALIEAAAKIGHAQGTRGCIAFKHGAEWYRAQVAALAPQSFARGRGHGRLHGIRPLPG